MIFFTSKSLTLGFVSASTVTASAKSSVLIVGADGNRL